PEHKVDMGIEYRIKGVRLNIGAQYVGETYNYYQHWGMYPDPKVSMDTKVNPGYTLVRVKLSKEFGIARLKPCPTFFVAADNLLDEKYSKFGNDMKDCGYPMPGRSFTLGVGVDF
ncbi:MAG: TonB-dependent receptor, partial [Candidatus Stahlbacteria bacterium]|nr:TonB-dependent receptor [Candidatus Stahlbacteria bacterium]